MHVNDANFVEIRNVCFDYRGRKIYHSVDMDIRRGKVTVIFGPSGSGKTTLLRLIGGQVKAGKGTVHVDGRNVAELSRKELLKLRARMGMLFQSGALFTDLSVFENVAFPLRVHTELPESMLRDIVLMKLQAVGLRGASSLMPHELSGGMQRRVALARAIAFDPEMVMYDEPFAGQDPISKGVLVRLIRLLNDSLQITSVIVSHDIKVSTSIADYMYLVADTEVVAHGTPQDLLADKSPRVCQFMQGLPDGPVPFHYPAPDYTQELMQS
ncbi:MAG: ATP-binding cassette domain-containing protein [Pseudomonadales bacterium]